MLDENGGEKDRQTIEEVSCGWSGPGRGNLENSAILMDDRISGCHRRFESAQSLEGDDSTAEGATRIEVDIVWRAKPGEAQNAAGGEKWKNRQRGSYHLKCRDRDEMGEQVNVIRLVISDEGSHTSGAKGERGMGGRRPA